MKILWAEGMGLVGRRDCQDMGCMPGVYVVDEVARTGVGASSRSGGGGRPDVLSQKSTSLCTGGAHDGASVGSAGKE